jgi:hypothetical protein
MAQASKSPTTNRIHFASAGAVRRRPAPMSPLALIKQSEAETLAEMCTLTVYSDGFTFSEEMMAICKVIADRSSPADRRVCLARAAERERAYVTR